MSCHHCKRLAWTVWLSLLLTACHWPWSDAADPVLLMLAGTVEAREVELAFQVGGYLQRLEVDEGDAVTVAKRLAVLDRRDYDLALQSAAAQAEAAKAALAALQAGARPQELRVAEAQLARAEADQAFARAEIRRIEHLVAKRLASQEQLDEGRMRQDVAAAVVAQARHSLDLLREGPRREDIDRAAAEHRVRQVAVNIAEQQLAYTELRSPVEGVVSVRLADSGEVVAKGQAVLRIAELTRPWVRAYLNETDLARVKLGQAAEVRADGLPDQVFSGRLSFISPEAEFTPKTVETRALRVDLVYRVKVDVDNPDGLLKLGMPVDVILKTADQP